MTDRTSPTAPRQRPLPPAPAGAIAGQRRLARLEGRLPAPHHHPPEEASTMTHRPSLKALEDDERQARTRLATYRARMYTAPPGDAIHAQQRLAELERRWKGAARRLQEAREQWERVP